MEVLVSQPVVTVGQTEAILVVFPGASKTGSRDFLMAANLASE
jgi:hypothetical protein